MNTRISFLVIVAVTSIAALITAWHQRHVRRELETSLAVLAEKRSAETMARPKLASRPAFDQDGQARSATAVTKAQDPGADLSRSSADQPLDVLHRDPATQVLWLASRRAAVAASYGPFFRSLALSPTQIETFQAVTIRREEHALDLTATIRAQRLTFDDPSVAGLRQKADDEERAARQALLGPEGYRDLQEYLRVLPLRDMVSALAGVAAIFGVPLSAEQTTQLTQLLASTSGRYQAGGVADLGSVDWDTADRLARTILSPEQCVLYETVEPEGRGGRFSGRVTRALESARRVDARTP